MGDMSITSLVKRLACGIDTKTCPSISHHNNDNDLRVLQVDSWYRLFVIVKGVFKAEPYLLANRIGRHKLFAAIPCNRVNAVGLLGVEKR